MTIFGLDLLGIGSKHWNIAGTVAAFPHGWALGAFDTTFGDARANVKKVLDTGKVSYCRIQMWYDPSHKLAPLDLLKKRLPLWQAIAKQYPHVMFAISHSCEYSEKSKGEIDKRVSLVQKLCPSCLVVETPMHSPVIGGFIVEQHGNKAKAKAGQYASTDGNEIAQMDAEKWMRANAQAAITFLWNGKFNLRESGPVLPPPQRKASPDANYIRGIVRMASPKGGAPTPTFATTPTPLKNPVLWKVYGEDSPGDSDARDNKPVFMCPEKAPSITIITFDKQTVCKFPIYPDNNPHKMERYYSGGRGGPKLYGYQIAKKALDLSGSEWVYVIAKKKVYGPIHPAFRCGFFTQ